MAGIAHLSFGFGSKWFAPKLPLWILLAAAEFLDILWCILWLLGIENMDGAPWSHGLFMSVIWSVLAGLVVAKIYKNHKYGILTGAVVFSHWLVDFITHPMGAIINNGEPLTPDLFLLFYNSPKVGLGLYNESVVLAYIFEFSILAVGIVSYVLFVKREKQQKRI